MEVTEAEKILSEVAERPGQKARQIARRLELDQKLVSRILYGTLKGKVRQDKAYKWYPVLDATKASPAAKTDRQKPGAGEPTLLGKLCNYYLACLAQSNDMGVSTFAKSKYGDPDYVELPVYPGFSNNPIDPFAVEGADSIVRKTKSSRGNKELYLGYPVRVRKHRAASGWEGTFVEPVLLWACDVEDGAVSLSNDYPFFNFKVLRAIGAAGDANHLEEAAVLSDDLGLDAQPGEGPEVDEMIERLRAIRPEWDWREETDIHLMSDSPSLAEITEPGIYNRTILITSERSAYTQGLETELKKLAGLPEEQYRDTALGHWLVCHEESGTEATIDDLIEVVPHNLEQRAAVAIGLTAPLAVVTGPPGTGKSQVVTSLITNSIWTNTTTLFASKNNKAVDVVHDRVNGLASSPSLLRLGSNDKNYALAEHLLGLLATSFSLDDKEEYEATLSRHRDLRASKAEMESQIERVRQARNQVDALDRPLAERRDDWGEDFLAVASNLDVDAAQATATSLLELAWRADVVHQPLPIKLLWRALGGARRAKLDLAWSAAARVVADLGTDVSRIGPESNIVNFYDVIGDFEERLDFARQVQEYRRALDTLESLPTLEELARQSVENSAKIGSNSGALWRQWMTLKPSRMTSDDRRTLSNYSATLQEMINSRGEDQRSARRIANRYYKIFPKIRHLLPCWAVTSLSARGKVPFEAGFFDMVVIDEASQCDIASALPLLFRAKRAVVIGDPMQLKHIAGITVEKDHRLQERYGIEADQAAWGYSVSSLFNLAVGICNRDALTMLRDHHRSHADIINFSNEFFYKGRLRVATSYDRLKRPSTTEPAVIWTHTHGEARRPAAGGAVNQQEAAALVAAITNLLDRGYQGTIGAVTPFRAQANLVRRLLGQAEHLTDRLAAAEFLVDTVHRFQGDEKDVIFFSPVVSKGMSRGALGFLRANGNLFNVAITRARSLLHVVGDRAAALHSGVDYLKAFAEYVGGLEASEHQDERPEAPTGRDYPVVSQPERVSDWERVFYTALYDEGIRPIPQYDVEQYTLDFAVFDGDRKLNIEVDGERYHKDWTGELCRRDQIRNQRLMELGWDVKRFWVYQIRDEQAKCVDWVAKWLNSGPKQAISNDQSAQKLAPSVPTKREKAITALGIYLGLQEPTSPSHSDFVYRGIQPPGAEKEISKQEQWLAEAIQKFANIPLGESNPNGDLVWAAVIYGLDVYSVASHSVPDNAAFVSRLEVMSFCVPELEQLDAVASMDEAARESIDQFYDDSAEGDFLPRENAQSMMMAMIEAVNNDKDVNDIGRSFYVPVYQLIDSWAAGDTNCEPEIFFETDVFRELWESGPTFISAERAADVWNTYFWYRKREHGGTCVVAQRDIKNFVLKLSTLAIRLGDRGFDRLQERAELRFAEQEAAIEAWEAAKTDEYWSDRN